MCTATIKETKTESKSVFVVLAFKNGNNEKVLPIGVFDNIEDANQIAKFHKQYRGGKYEHRIYPFELNRWDGNVGTIFNNLPFI